MNKQEKDVLLVLSREKVDNQRMLAELSGYSLGVVNKSLQQLKEKGFVKDLQLSLQGREYLKEHKVKKAIILAAGFGMRMVPINLNLPKALLQVHGEALIERLIRQLHEKDIFDISIIVGFQKEHFEYLIDKYGVKLVVNPHYAEKNNLHSLKLLVDEISNTYILPCDIYCEKNLFQREELYSWYMLSEEETAKTEVRVNKKQEIVKIEKDQLGNKMVGIAYISAEEAPFLQDRIRKLSEDANFDQHFWDEALFQGEKMEAFAKLVKAGAVKEINKFEDLVALDPTSKSLHSEAIDRIQEAFQVPMTDIKNIQVLKKGMTNRSFLFQVGEKRYIMRIPGEGTEQLINRAEEAAVYDIINHKGLCDDVVYINPKNGYKITEFIPGGRSCDADSIEDLETCMQLLRDFHAKKLKVEHEFKVFEKIEFYETLWNGIPSAYPGYEEIKKNVLSLEDFIDAHVEEKILTHVDAVPDNFLMIEQDGKKDIRLLDWEYAAMQDPHIDIAMFSIYALYNKEQIDRLIDIYFEGSCPKMTRIKIYAYVAACGLLWSNWCEYKRNLGVEFGEYSLRQYRYAKDYYKIVKEELEAE